MKIETIYFLERKNLGNYEHVEMSATAKVEEGEDSLAAMIALKALVSAAINNKAVAVLVEKEATKEVVKTNIVNDNPVDIGTDGQAVKEEKPKGKSSKASKVEKTMPSSEEKQTTSSDTGTATTETKEEKTRPVKATKYSSDIPEHKSIFGAYLTKKYADKWKTVKPAAEIKTFTASLNGKDFIDANGVMVQSFLDLVHGFFGA